MLVEFLAHAGFVAREGPTTIVLDPWLHSSSFEQPIVEGWLPGSRTIDFQIPPVRAARRTLLADAILLSHFHAHHAPLREIRDLVGRKAGVVVCFPSMDRDTHRRLAERLGDAASRAVLRPMKDGDRVTVGGLSIVARAHTAPGHLMFDVRSPGARFVHIADAVVNADLDRRHLDPTWDRLASERPDLLVLSAGAHCTRTVDRLSGKRYIQEHSIMSPVEAARLVALVCPRLAAIMGIYNHSIWRDRVEFALPAEVAEREFQWALEYLAPDVGAVALRPGFTFRLGDGDVTCWASSPR